jgi:hypothetical protein
MAHSCGREETALGRRLPVPTDRGDAACFLLEERVVAITSEWDVREEVLLAVVYNPS